MDSEQGKPNPKWVQRDAMLGSTEDGQTQTLEAMLALISAEATAQAKRKRTCVQCGKMLQSHCMYGVMPTGSRCPNIDH